ncbi:MAG: hypothetical protein ABI359_01530 [Ginsengibacter sp.]
MKQIKSSLVIIISACLLISCSGNTSSADKTNADAKTSGSDSNTASSDANLTGTNGIFSYTVKGKHIVARNYVQQSNLFINEVSDDASNGIVLIKVTCETSNVFNFTVANSGTTTITNYSPSLGNFADKKTKVATYMEGGTYKNYYGDSVTVNITSIDASRVSGTFSGTFKADADDVATVNITDGSFNLPFIKR